MEFRDYYKIIGVARDAGADEIRKAYRKLARKYHPDVSKEPDADERMKEINEAYAVLSDTEAGRLRPAWQRLPAGPGVPSPAGLGQWFRVLRRGRLGRRGSRLQRLLRRTVRPHERRRPALSPGRRRFPLARRDHHAKVMLDLEDAFHGATRQVGLRVPKLDAEGAWCSSRAP